MTAPYQKHSETSLSAAQQILPKAGTLRYKLLEYIISCGKDGCTDEEAQQNVPMAPSTPRPRREELVEMGLIKDSGDKRLTNSGRKAVVWISEEVLPRGNAQEG